MMESDLTAGAVQASIGNIPPNLLVTIAGQETKKYTLSKDRISVGRAEDNDIVVASQIMSRHHTTLEKTSLGTRSSWLLVSSIRSPARATRHGPAVIVTRGRLAHRQ